MISDPLASPVYERTEIHNLPEALGLLDENNMNSISALE
jgi:hypothetical protein